MRLFGSGRGAKVGSKYMNANSMDIVECLKKDKDWTTWRLNGDKEFTHKTGEISDTWIDISFSTYLEQIDNETDTN